MLSHAVEDVFSSPAVMLATFEVQHTFSNSIDANPDAEAAAAAAAGTQNRGGPASTAQDHGLDLTFMNALYTALLKVPHIQLLKKSINLCAHNVFHKAILEAFAFVDEAV